MTTAPVGPMTVDEYQILCERGVFAERTELVRGHVRWNMGKGTRHALAMRLVIRALMQLEAADWITLPDVTVRLSPVDTRDPDVCLARADLSRGYLQPQEAALVVEIADSTLARDLQVKRLDYASVGIPEYWVVDLEGHRVHVFRDPAEGDYRTALSFGIGESFESRGQTIQAQDLLPE